MTEKQQQFLWIVQTGILINVINLTVDRVPGADRADVSMAGNWGAITDAIWASKSIPDSMAVEEAAHEYCTFMLADQRNVGNQVLACPSWFSRA